jgi:hypothetical protein
MAQDHEPRVDARQQLADVMLKEFDDEWAYQIRRAEELHGGKVVAVEETPYGICLVVDSKPRYATVGGRRPLRPG